MMVKLGELLKNRYFFILIVIGIVLVNIFFRIFMLRFAGLYEPDGFFYYSVVKETIQNNFIVPHYSNLSGFPNHNPIGEAPGLIYVTTIPYFFLRYFGISALDIMRLLPLFFDLFVILGVYLLSMKFVKDKLFGLLTLFFMSISVANLARINALIYRGDTFVPVFLIFSLLFLIKVFESDGRKRYYYSIISGLILSFGILLWNGSPFMIVIYFLSILLLEAYGFVTAREEVLKDSLLLSLALFLTFLLERVYILLNLARSWVVFTGIGFFYLFIPLLIGSFAGFYLLKNRDRFGVAGARRRLAVTLLLFLIGAVTLLASNIISALPINGGKLIAQTTQELQKPDLNYMIISFGPQIFLAFIGLLLFIFFSDLLGNKENYRIWKLRINLNVVFIVILSYLAVTAYLQSTAIRFNSVLSIPVAIFSAYAIYGIGRLVKERVADIRLFIGSIIVIDLFLILFLFLISPLTIPTATYLISKISRTIALIVGVATLVYGAYLIKKRNMRLFVPFVGLTLIIFSYNFYTTFISAYNSFQADNINRYFLNAMQWLGSNTPSNATVLAIWPDGSVAEGWGNRQSYIDSVGGENGTRISRMTQFLFNTTPDTQYLYNSGKPQYLLARGYWFYVLPSLVIEGSIQNSTDYGYITLDKFNLTFGSNNTRYYNFYSTSPPYFRAQAVLQKLPNGSQKFGAFVGQGNNLVLVKGLIFFDIATYNYSVFLSTVPGAINQTLMISYVGSNITGGTILRPKLPYTNLYRISFLCNRFSCAYNNNNVTLTAIYQNNDTAIFKINYLK